MGLCYLRMQEGLFGVAQLLYACFLSAAIPWPRHVQTSKVFPTPRHSIDWVCFRSEENARNLILTLIF